MIEAHIVGQAGDRVWVQAWFRNRDGVHGLAPVELTLGNASPEAAAGRLESRPAPPARSVPAPRVTAPRQTDAERGEDASELVAAVRIPLQAVVTDLELAADGQHLFALNRSDSQILKVDLVTFEVVERANVAARPVGMSLTPDGRRLYVASETDDGGWIRILSPELRQLGAFPIEVRPDDVAATDDGTVFLSGNHRHGIAVVNARRKVKLGKACTSTSEPRVLALHPDQKRLYAGNDRGYCRVDLNAFEEAPRSDRIYNSRHVRHFARGSGHGIAVSPDGKYLFADRGMILKLTRGAEADLEQLQGFRQFTTIAFAGETPAFFVATATGSVFVYSLRDLSNPVRGHWVSDYLGDMVLDESRRLLIAVASKLPPNGRRRNHRTEWAGDLVGYWVEF